MKRFSIWNIFSLKIKFFSPSPQRILNEILQKNIPVWGIEHGENSVSFRIFPTRKRFFSPFRENLSHEELWEESPCGALLLLHRFRKRLGFFIGLFLLIISLFLSTSFLWGIEIEGDTEKSYHEILEELEEFGLKTGKPLSKLDGKDIALRFSIAHEEYVFVGINIVGACAKVEIREREDLPEAAPDYNGASNLVARIYGKIVRYEVLSGQIAVRRGDWVKEGDLLIGGIRESKTGSFYPVRAYGRVFAETVRNFSVTVPFEETAEFYEEIKRERSIKILGFSIDLPSFSKGQEEADKLLEFDEPVELFGYTFPLVVRERFFLKSDSKKESIKVDRAEKLAYDKYEQFKRGTFAETDEILSENVCVFYDEKGVTLTSELAAVENICRESPFNFTAIP